MRLLVLALALSACTADPGPYRFTLTLTNVSAPGALVDSQGEAHDIAFAPGVLVVHPEGFRLFQPGQVLNREGMEPLVEDGNNEPLASALAGEPDVQLVSFQDLDDDYNAAPLAPGVSVTRGIIGHLGDAVSLVAMFGPSNDVFAALPDEGVPLFDERRDPLDGDISVALDLWDAGTEVNEELALGPNQPANQAAPGDGEVEGGVVVLVDGTDASGFSYPDVGSMLTLTVSAEPAPDEE